MVIDQKETRPEVATRPDVAIDYGVLRSWFHVSPCRLCGDRDAQTGRRSRHSADVVPPVGRETKNEAAATEKAR